MAATSSKFTTKYGNLLDATEDYICHQCNCVTTHGRGLSQDLFKKYPEADVYTSKSKRGVGEISIHPINVGQSIVNMYAQYKPGKPTKSEMKEMRIEWFQQCLGRLVETAPPGSTFAFPWKIGCGLAGGNWDTYETMLRVWSTDSRVGQVVVYKY